MICDKCGKDNLPGAQKCVSCKGEMPPTASCGGFSDILSFAAPLENQGTNTRGMMSGIGGGIDKMEFEKLQKKYANLAETSRKTVLIALGAAVVGVIALILSVSFWLGTKGNIKELEDKIESIEVTDVKEEADEKEDTDTTTGSNSTELPDENGGNGKTQTTPSAEQKARDISKKINKKIEEILNSLEN